MGSGFRVQGLGFRVRVGFMVRARSRVVRVRVRLEPGSASGLRLGHG